ncbi:uncharacterized protein LOC130649170 [Hydractinia symbiolongicarpus]|uniref:uncharacterized protein LOC130649170 n=1 Tax=Hydractinia symbiolongicarpus TaxID=13093 RepID=UPI002550B7F4|nr:uncharacterized protein LOC130649170 [Hydractinia symbiolongicarpus]
MDTHFFSKSKQHVGVNNNCYMVDICYCNDSDSGNGHSSGADTVKTPTTSERETEPTTANAILQINDPNQAQSITNEEEIAFKIEIQRRKQLTISYEVLMWFVFTVVTILCIVDRFVYTGDCVLKRKGKTVSRLWGDNFGQTLTNVVWGVTARLITTSQNLMFYTTLWCLPNMMTEIAPRFLKITRIRDIHIKAHRIAGIFLIGIPSLAHVLVIFLPPLIDRTELTYSPPSHFNFSNQLGHLNWTKWWDPAAVENWSFNDKSGVHLTSDEIYRLLLMIILFCFLFPLSRSSYLNDRSYSFAIALHAFAGVWYAIDNIRKITHGLAHVINLPFFIFWCIDRLLSIVLYRRSNCTISAKQVTSDGKYIVVYMKSDVYNKRTVGDVYYLSLASKRRQLLSLERAHPYTSFNNHSKDKSWDIGFVIRVMDDHTQWFSSWTRRLFNVDESNSLQLITAWGPYRASCFHLYQQLKQNRKKCYTLFASGSGLGYLLDVLSFLAYKSSKRDAAERPHLDMYYTVSCAQFTDYFHEKVENLIKEVVFVQTATVSFHWSITAEKKGNFPKVDRTDSAVTFTRDRINFEKIISRLSRSTAVYFVGRPSLAEHVDRICEKHNITLVKHYTNSQRGMSDKLQMTFYLKRLLLVLSVTVGVSIALSIYIDARKIKNMLLSHV